MIGYLKGQVLEHEEGRMLVAIGGDAGAVGYSVLVPQGHAYMGFLPGKTVELFVHTHVREDALDLYGFSSRMEKDLFLTLLDVNGIGPKGAAGILSKIEPDQLIHAILEGDKEALVQIPGIGKKTAERVVLELKDKIAKKVEAGVFGASRPQATAGSKAGKNQGKAGGDPIFRDAKEALVGLGYREQDVSALLNRVFEGGTPPKRVEDVIRTALQQLG